VVAHPGGGGVIASDEDLADDPTSVSIFNLLVRLVLGALAAGLGAITVILENTL
jgi:hypothetical protein